ncbi:MAG: M16 family metallopeptidase [Cytophagaceae bacterium]
MDEDFEILTLKNGIRVIHKHVTHTKVAHVGFILDVGSRDEHREQQGLAHFWEHMAFKGTKNRKSFHVINRLEVLGGELNAYTTKEKICFYASLLDVHYDKAFELLQDITFNSIFPSKEIEKERTVILEEMSMYEDTPEEAIQDSFENIVFGDHPLGYNILGTEDTVKSFKRSHFNKFVRENFDTSRLIVSSVGNIPFSKVKALAERYLSNIPTIQSRHKRVLFKKYAPRIEEKKRPIHQAHCMMGAPAYGLMDDKRIPFYMLVNLLGGPGMNSRLNLSLRERHGYVYSVEASYNAFVDVGLFSIYFGTEQKHLEKSRSLVMKELKKLREVPLGAIQLHGCKEQIMGQLAMSEENKVSFMQMMGKSVLDLGEVQSLESIFKKIKSVNARQLRQIANEIFREDEFSELTYLPE